MARLASGQNVHMALHDDPHVPTCPRGYVACLCTTGKRLNSCNLDLTISAAKRFTENFPQFFLIHRLSSTQWSRYFSGTPLLSPWSNESNQWAIWSLVPLLLWNSASTSVSSQFMYCRTLAWRILNITLLACDRILNNIFPLFSWHCIYTVNIRNILLTVNNDTFYIPIKQTQIRDK